MKKLKKPLYSFLTVVMMISLLLPIGNGVVKAESNDGETGSLTIHKFEQEPGSDQGEGDGSKIDDSSNFGKALEGVTFTLKQTHSYDSSTDKWTEIDKNDQKSFTKTTNSNGKIVINNIELGRYTVQETNGPDNVVLNEDEYSVDIPMTSEDGTDVNYNVHVYPKNEIIRGNVQLTKKDGDTKEKLKNVKFDLYKVGNDSAIETGLSTKEDGTITVGKLAYGDYYFKETATIDGYLLKGKKIEFSIKEQGASKEVSLNNYKKPEIEKDVDKDAVNREETVTYTLSIDLPGDIKDYDKFDVTDELDSNLEYVEGSESSPNGFDFDKNGQTLTWTGDPEALTPGKVDITFDAKISKDATANEEINNEVKIDYNNGFVTDTDKDNISILPTAGTLKVLKQDGDSKEKLGGAKFDLMQGDTVVTSGTTNSDGIIDFGELDYGEYQLVETKAPADYNKLRNPIDVTVNKDNNDQTITVDNYKSNWELPKTDGMGTIFFTLIGLTFMGAATLMYIRRRKGENA